MDFSVICNKKNADISISPRSSADGVELYDISVSYPEPTPAELITIRFFIPAIDIYSVYMPWDMFNLSLRSDWCAKTNASNINGGSPVICFLSSDGKNRLTVTHDDFTRHVHISEGVNEFSKSIRIDLKLFPYVSTVIKDYHLTLRLDFGDKRYDSALRDAVSFWEKDCGACPTHIPVTARRPLYSCWYVYHQDISPDKVVKQCALAKKYGMDSVIVDDGWQCDDSSGGYRYVGDWEVAKSKIPDMADFVKRVHDSGLKFILWYYIGGVGVYSKAHERFKNMLLNPQDENCAELDPRFPEVREYLTEKFRRAILDWDLDGFKIDFLDAMYAREGTLPPGTPGMDHDNVEDALIVLLDEITSMARTIKPDFLIEFRQMFFGPALRRYATMFRVGDCANDSIRNRVYGTGMRLILGSSPVHSDMIMWNPDDTPESVAYQLISSLFTVPQISVPLDSLSDEHGKVLKFWLDFWNDHSDLITKGQLSADNPESNFSLVSTELGNEKISVSYSKQFFEVKNGIHTFIVNATDSHSFCVKIQQGDNRSYKVLDCMGNIISHGNLNGGISEITVPRCALIEII